MPKSDLVDEGVGAIHYGQIYTTYGAWATDTISAVPLEKASKLAQVHPGDIVITNTSENVEDVGKAVAWLGDEPIVTGGHATVIRHAQDPKFLSYWFQTEAFARQKRALATGTKVIDVSAKQLAKVRVPVPPLEVQREIVRILDQFMQLEAALEAEVEARTEQRRALANNLILRSQNQMREAGVEPVTLGSFASEVIEPVDVEPDEMYPSLGVKWNGLGVIAREPRRGRDIKATRLFRVRAGQLICNRMFVVEGSFAVVPDEHDGAVVSSEFPVFDLDRTRVDPGWLLRVLCDPYTLRRIEREVTGTERGTMKSRRRWKADQLRKFEVHLPPLDEQRRIARVLGGIDALVCELDGELSARRKQHGYYRDRLLSFEELP